MRKPTDRELARVNGNSLLWVLCTVFSVMVFISVVSEGFLNPGKCVTQEEAAAGGVIPIVLTDARHACG